MNFTSLLRKPVTQYSSVVWRESASSKGIRFAIRRVSLQRRIELTRSIREIAAQNEFLRAGSEAEQLSASVCDLLTRKAILEWGLSGIQGLSIDGQEATVELLIEKGPEALAAEIIDSIQAEAGLSESERKNS